MARRGLRQIATSSIRLRCPRCGTGRLFSGLFSMRARCPDCDLKFEREQGYFVGAIYINYAATVAIAVPGYLLLDYLTGLSLGWQLGLWIPFAIFFPLLFFRYSRSLWLGLDYLFNPAWTTDATKARGPLTPGSKSRGRAGRYRARGAARYGREGD